jgi:hypothetical protein
MNVAEMEGFTLEGKLEVTLLTDGGYLN